VLGFRYALGVVLVLRLAVSPADAGPAVRIDADGSVLMTPQAGGESIVFRPSFAIL
jgi:hypothetical protein